MKDLFSLESYNYTLPEELIAKFPAKKRDASRLMIVERASGKISEIPFFELLSLLQKGDAFVFNDTKVIPARLLGKRPSGGAAEVFLLKQKEPWLWEALIRPGRKLPIGQKVIFGKDFSCEIIDVLQDGSRLVRFEGNADFYDLLARYGQIPLPQYIDRRALEEDNERYQTVFAKNPGAVAAPTAALHFSKEMFSRMDAIGVSHEAVTLHVGAGTFRPVKEGDIRNHLMHEEPFFISEKAAKRLSNRASGRRQICVGTTTCRALESAASADGNIAPGGYDTSIFIYPGYSFKYVSSLLTNFHLPGSSLLMLVSAFAGYELMMEAYAKAVEKKFRFYSYGDAMLII